MTNTSSLAARLSSPAITDTLLCEKICTQMLKVKVNTLYHNGLISRSTRKPFRDHCLERFQSFTGIENDAVLSDLIGELSRCIAQSVGAEEYNDDGQWLSQYKDTLLFIAQLHNHFTVKSPCRGQKGADSYD